MYLQQVSGFNIDIYILFKLNKTSENSNMSLLTPDSILFAQITCLTEYA